ncbi:MAG: sugar lactone lactonase YvrE [Cellvibrionaceae bacterium]|jgi:sugar lactone lactonase YvrE
MLNQFIVLWFIALLSFPVLSSSYYRQRLEPRLVELWVLDESLSRPESVVYDKARDVLYVSNINGSPTEKDGNGYIAMVSVDGDIIEQEWVSSLDAPKGMAVSGDYLYVADIDRLVEISLATGQVINSYPGEGAQFLNDVAADKRGNIYVSDSRQKTIYRLHNGGFDVWVDDDRISEPNGIFARYGKLVVAAGDNSTERPGRSRFLQTINFKNKKIKPLGETTSLGSLDGVEKSGMGGYFLSDFRSGDISYYTKSQGATVLVNPEPGTADIDYVIDQNILYVPILNTGKLIAYKVLWCR